MDERLSCDFSEARVGDKVWDIELGPSTVIEVCTQTFWIAGAHSRADRYFDGRKSYSSPIPYTYWSRPEFAIPPPPKRTKKVTVWVRINCEPNTSYFDVDRIAYPTQDEARVEAARGSLWKVYPIEIEVEE